MIGSKPSRPKPPNPISTPKNAMTSFKKTLFQSFSDGPKVLLMWMPEYLGKEGNKLLKLIEEPTDNTYLILVANDQERILNTILSRCQLMKFLPFHESTLRAYLINEMSLSEEAATQIARSSDGSIKQNHWRRKGRIKPIKSCIWLASHLLQRRQRGKWRLCKWNGFNEPGQPNPFSGIRLALFWDLSGLFAQQWNPLKWQKTKKSGADKMKAIIDAQKIESIVNTINQLIFISIATAIIKSIGWRHHCHWRYFEKYNPIFPK